MVFPDPLYGGYGLLHPFLMRIRITVEAVVVRTFVGVQENLRTAFAFIPCRRIGSHCKDIGTYYFFYVFCFHVISRF